jgi:hypothetical protein
MLLGVGFYAVGLGEKTDRLLNDKFPQVQQVIDRQSQIWNDPEDGRLMGQIAEVANESLIILDAFGEEWEVHIAEGANQFNIPIVVGIPIRLIGEISGEYIFDASIVAPLQKPRKGPRVQEMRILEMTPQQVPFGQ